MPLWDFLRGLGLILTSPSKKLATELPFFSVALILARLPSGKSFKNEFRILLCTKDKKYASVRKSLSQAGDKTQLTIVSAISAAVGASVGAVEGSLIPLCAICLIAVLKMGKEAFCRAEILDVKVRP